MRITALLFVLIAVSGCDARIERFDANEVYALTLTRSRSTPAEVASQDAAQVVETLFGSPDQPRWPEGLLDPAETSLVQPDRLARAAGGVSSDKEGTQRGLFREHCVICHGLSGSGAGPASLFQNPYPRDFRHGVFKWKSTDRSSKPTRTDLHRLLVRGAPGTAMPSFSLLSPDDLEALVDYVIYLSVRGEVERRLMAAAIDDLGYEETSPEQSLQLTAVGDSEGGQAVRDILNRVVTRWHQADRSVVSVPQWTSLQGPSKQQSVDRGKEIFHGPIANCVGCHGPEGNGEVITLDYDDWSKEYSTRIGLTPSDREAMRPFRDAGALRPRAIKPRRLTDGVFQGGGEPDTLFRRITQGIAGTPMPTVQVVAEENGKGLTEDQVWDLVRYIRSLDGSE